MAVEHEMLLNDSCARTHARAGGGVAEVVVPGLPPDVTNRCCHPVLPHEGRGLQVSD